MDNKLAWNRKERQSLNVLRKGSVGNDIMCIDIKFSPLLFILLLDVQGEDSVGATGVCVHGRGTGSPIHCTLS